MTAGSDSTVSFKKKKLKKEKATPSPPKRSEVVLDRYFIVLIFFDIFVKCLSQYFHSKLQNNNKFVKWKNAWHF